MHGVIVNQGEVAPAASLAPCGIRLGIEWPWMPGIHPKLGIGCPKNWNETWIWTWLVRYIYMMWQNINDHVSQWHVIEKFACMTRPRPFLPEVVRSSSYIVFMCREAGKKEWASCQSPPPLRTYFPLLATVQVTLNFRQIGDERHSASRPQALRLDRGFFPKKLDISSIGVQFLPSLMSNGAFWPTNNWMLSYSTVSQYISKCSRSGFLP